MDSRTNTSVWTGLNECVRDPNMWALIFMQHFHMAASNFKNFFPAIVETLGFDQNTTLALTCAPCLISGIIAIAYSWNSGRMNERTWHITIAKVVAVLGFVLACSTTNVGARYFAMSTFASGVYACTSVILGWVSSTCGQTKEKKAFAMALVNTVAAISPIYTPYLWPDTDEPSYPTAMGASAAFSLVAAILALVTREMLRRQNHKIRQSNSETTLFYAY